MTEEKKVKDGKKNVAVLPENLMADIMESIQNCKKDFVDVADADLTQKERKRKVSAGTRNYGFIDKVSDYAVSDPNYAHFFSVNSIKNCLRNVEICRELYKALVAFARDATNAMLNYSNDAYFMALNYYNTVKEQARQGDSDAVALENDLKTYFNKSKPETADPTHKQAEKDYRALLHGTKDGRLLIENFRPKLTGGMRCLVDEVDTGKAAFKESEEGSVRK
jgi:hypothetical protein